MSYTLHTLFTDLLHDPLDFWLIEVDQRRQIHAQLERGGHHHGMHRVGTQRVVPDGVATVAAAIAGEEPRKGESIGGHYTVDDWVAFHCSSTHRGKGGRGGGGGGGGGGVIAAMLNVVGTCVHVRRNISWCIRNTI